MNNADVIRNMDDEELVDLLVWGSVYSCGIEVPNCIEGCAYFSAGCGVNCPSERRERAVRKWLERKRDDL